VDKWEWYFHTHYAQDWDHSMQEQQAQGHGPGSADDMAMVAAIQSVNPWDPTGSIAFFNGLTAQKEQAEKNKQNQAQQQAANNLQKFRDTNPSTDQMTQHLSEHPDEKAVAVKAIFSVGLGGDLLNAASQSWSAGANSTMQSGGSIGSYFDRSYSSQQSTLWNDLVGSGANYSSSSGPGSNGLSIGLSPSDFGWNPYLDSLSYNLFRGLDLNTTASSNLAPGKEIDMASEGFVVGEPHQYFTMTRPDGSTLYCNDCTVAANPDGPYKITSFGSISDSLELFITGAPRTESSLADNVVNAGKATVGGISILASPFGVLLDKGSALSNNWFGTNFDTDRADSMFSLANDMFDHNRYQPVAMGTLKFLQGAGEVPAIAVDAWTRLNTVLLDKIGINWDIGTSISQTAQHYDQGQISDLGLWGEAAKNTVLSNPYIGLPYAAATSAFGLSTAIQNNDLEAGTQNGLGLLLSFMGAKVGGFENVDLQSPIVLGEGVQNSGAFGQRGSIISIADVRSPIAKSSLPSGIGGTGQNYDRINGQGLYVLLDETGQVKYVGRGDVPARLSSHENSIDKGDLISRELWSNNLSKAQAKGLEQALMDNFGGPRRSNPGTQLLNEYRSYSLFNPNALSYRSAVTGELWQATLKKLGQPQ